VINVGGMVEVASVAGSLGSGAVTDNGTLNLTAGAVTQQLVSSK
jgi:hypothetical protein